MHDFIDNLPLDNPRTSRLFVKLFRRVLVVWLFGVVVAMMLVTVFDRTLIAAALTISFGSGLVAMVALCPVAWAVRSSSRASSDAADQDFAAANSGRLLSAFTAGIALRLFGTVALFVLCRYQLGQQSAAIAMLVGGWYVLLTSVEVNSLVKTISDTHRLDTHRLDTRRSGTKRQIWTTE